MLQCSHYQLCPRGIFYSKDVEIIFTHGKIENFISTLDRITIRRVYKLFMHLEQLGHQIRMPFSKSIGDGLFELRLKGSIPIRIIYAFHGDTALILNIFIKKTWLIPHREIQYAQNILKEYLA